MSLSELRKDYSRRELLWFGPVFALFVGIVGFAFLREPSTRVALWSAAAVVLAVYYAIPAFRTPMVVGWMLAMFPIGWIVSHVLLASVYYLVLTPLAIAMRICRYDPMQRKLEPKSNTYWSERPTDIDRKRYFQQF